MAKYDVYQNPYGGSAVYLVDVQTELLDYLDTRVIVPLFEYSKNGSDEEEPKLKPAVTLNGEKYIFSASDMTTVEKRVLKKPIGNIQESHYVVLNAIDFVFQGF